MKATTNHLILILSFILFFIANSAARVLYVHIDANGQKDGSSWTNAFSDIQSAIVAANNGDTICVAAGEYQPTFLFGSDSLRNLTFYINKPISLFGGFTGIPGSEADFAQRDPKLNRTVLSGDVGIIGDYADNVFHVVYLDHVSDSLRLDGFAISFGNTHGAAGIDAYGAGIFNNATAGHSSPTLVNNAICFNNAAESGGGVMNYAAEGGVAKPVIMNCIITENEASGGGGISNYADTEGEASPVFINCKIAGNVAKTADGGAMNAVGHISVVRPQLINCIVSGNSSTNSAAIQLFVTGSGIAQPEIINSAMAGNSGGSMRIVDLGTGLSKAIIRNSILWGNSGGHGLSTNNAEADVSFSIIQSGFPGEGNISDDPQFVSEPTLDVPHIEGDLHLLETSVAIDAGSNAMVNSSIETDYDNLPRFVDPTSGQPGIIDIGPYEIQSITTDISSPSSDLQWKVFPNPVHDRIIVHCENHEMPASISLLDVNGSILRSNVLQPGQAEEVIPIKGLTSGYYFLHLISGHTQSITKIMLQ